MQALSPKKRTRSARGNDTAAGPFVGPGPFTEAHRDLFFGRQADIARLRSLLRTERIVVLHSPSGAGKTSLVQAGLVPRLRDADGFRVFPTIRVGQELPKSERVLTGANRYAYSAVHSLESGFANQGRDQSGVHADAELVGIRLSTYFAHRSAVLGDGAEARLLIFDQFEELFTRSPHDHRARVEFFTDLAKVLRDRGVWALFAMREEYVAALDRYKRLLPAQLAVRFHLDLLNPAGARQAISRPAQSVGVTVHEGALDLIVGDLAKASPHRASESGVRDRPEPDAAVIDPLHLQLLCVDIWKQLPSDTTELDERTIQRLRAAERRGVGDLSAVDWALLRYYDRTLQQACKRAVEKTRRESHGRTARGGELGTEDPQGERSSREERHRLERRARFWIDDHLIEAGRYRRQTIAEEDDLLFGETQELLEDEHILRANVRIGTKWYEIAHDRMVAPLRLSNDDWYNLYHDRFQRLSRRYHEEKYPQQFDYLSPQELEQEGYGKNLSQDDRDKLQEHELRYLKFCRQQARRRRWRIAVVGLVLLSLASGALITWPYFRKQLKKAYVATKALQGKIAEQKIELNKLQNTKTVIRRRGQVGRLYSSAMVQRYRFENHDVALLLTKLALDENQALPPESRQPKLQLDSAFWATVEAEPFSQTVPTEILGDRPTSLAAMGHSVYVSVGHDVAEHRLAKIDTIAHRLEFETPCRPEIQFFAPDRRLAAIVSENLEIVEVAGGHCRTLARKSAGDSAFSPVAPVWSTDQTFLAAFLENGDIAVYQIGREHPKPLRRISRRPRESAVGGDSSSTYRITAVAFHDGMVATGDEGGGVRLVDLTGSNSEPREFTVWEQYWPYNKVFGHPASRAEDAEIVALDFLSVPTTATADPPGEWEAGPEGDEARPEGDEAGLEAEKAETDADETALDADEAETWLCLVHRGSGRTKGGKVFLHRLENIGESYELIADSASRIREGVLRQLGRGVERPGGEAIESARFSSNGAWLATAGVTGTVTRWDLGELHLSAQATLYELGHQQALNGITDTSIPANDIDHPVARARRDVLRGAQGRVSAVLVTEDGRHVAAIQRDAKVRLWYLERLSVAYRSKEWGEVGYLYDLAFDSENRLITTDNRGRLQSWRASLATKDGCHGSSASHESPMQLCIEKDSYLETQLSLPGEPTISILSLDLSDGLLVLGTGDRVPRLLDLERHESPSALEDGQWKVNHKGKISVAALRPSNRELEESYDVVTGDQEGTLIFWNLPHRSDETSATVESAFAFDLGGPITGLAFHPGGRWLVAANLAGPLHLIDMTGRACAVGEPSEISAERPCRKSSSPVTFKEVHALAFSATGNRLAAAGDALSWWNFAADSDDPLSGSGEPVPGAAGSILDMAFMPGEEDTLAVTAGGSIQFWALEEGSWPIELRGGGSELFSIAFSPDGGLLAAGDGRGRFTVWDMNISKYVCQLTMRNLTPEEWELNASRMKPQQICKGLTSG